MMLKVFAPYDSKISTWLQPMFFQHTGQAERTWKELCSNADSFLAKHPQDFTLYQIGEFDDDTAALSSITPVQVMSAAQAMLDSSPVSRIS